MNIRVALESVRNKHDAGNHGIIEMRDFLLEHGLEKEKTTNLLGYIYSTNITNEQIIENVENNINYKDVVKNPDLLQTYKKREVKEKQKKKTGKNNMLPIFVFWAGLAAFFINFYLAITIFFIAAILFVRSSNTKEKSFFKSAGLIIWVFVWITIVASIMLLSEG